jgi:predicted amidohydrolase YtcJ
MHIQMMLMKSKVLIPIVLLLFGLLYIFYDHHEASSATLILLNGVVYTVNEKQPLVEAIAIRDNKIIAVGSNEEINSSFASAKTIDLKGKAVYPGFTDAHAHLEGLGALLANVNLSDTKSVEEIRMLVAERAATVPVGSWVRGRSWDQNKWPDKSFPTHQMLDEVGNENPVYLKRVDGHAVWVNQKALDIAKITKSTPDPDGGKILRDAQGNPTGVLIDNAVRLIDSVMPTPTEVERTEAIQKAVQECLKVGLTEVHDMGADLEMIGIYKKLIQAKKFPFRVYAAIDGIGATWDYYLKQGPEVSNNDNRLTVRALKLYADGALGSRGAALIEPYSDDSTNRGLTLTPTDTMKKATLDALNKGFQVCIHAIGDRANHIVLNVCEEMLDRDERKAKSARLRVEHAQIVDVNDIPRFKKLGVLPSMQPTHCTSDMYWAEERVGAKRIKGAYAWRSFLNTGSIIPGGSDFPVESPSPLLGFYAAITRQDKDGLPAGGWDAEQRMQRHEALKAFTLWAAYAAFEENTRGTIEVGKLADVVVLSNDIMKCEPKQILDTKVEYTIVGGEIVYSSAAPAL